MTDRGSCPDIVVLSSFLDGEIAANEKESVRVHIEICSGCAQRVKGLKTAGELMINNLGRPTVSTEHSRSADCVSGDTLSAYLHDLLSAEESSPVESHLDGCDACLSELATLAKTDRQLRQTPAEPLPGYLREKVEALWKKREKAKDQILKIVCRLAQDGIQFLRDSLLPEGFAFQEGFATSGAYRSAGGSSLPASIFVKGDLSNIQLGLSIEWEASDKAGLRLKIEDEESRPFSGQRILLRREQVLIYSERTDADGRLAVRSLEPGAYQLGIVISGKEFVIDVEIRNH